MQDLSAFLHSSAWQSFQEAAGAAVARDGHNLFVHRNLPGKGSYWISSRCTIPADWKVPDFAKDAWFVRLEPADTLSYQHLAKLPLVKTVAIQPKQTTYLNLRQTQEELLAAMKSKHRYNIRLAEKHGVEVEVITEQVSAQFPRFWKLLEETADRHDFRLHTKDYYQTMLATLEKEQLVRLGFAHKDGEDLAAVLVLTYNGTATYLHGASTKARRELMAPHLLHWRMITQLQEEGLAAYDFWGVNAQQTEEGWEPLPNHASTGTTRFKLGFGGPVVEYPGCYDLILNRFCYTLYKGIRGLRSRKRAFS